MKMPALMTPKNAVTASNMVWIPDPAIGPNAFRPCTVKRISRAERVSKVNDDFEQQAAAAAVSRKKTEAGAERMIYQGDALPISAVFGLRYVHDLVRKWAA
jgi:hypothetical protein